MTPRGGQDYLIDAASTCLAVCRLCGDRIMRGTTGKAVAAMNSHLRDCHDDPEVRYRAKKARNREWRG